MSSSSISWDECFMQMADTVSKRSKDPNTKVGAVLVSPGNNAVHIGYNGFPSGLEETEERWDDKHSYVVHAEMNAVLNAKCDLDGWTLYTTMFPCSECIKLILQSGIKKIVYSSESSRMLQGTIEQSRALLNEMSVKVVKSGK